MKVIVRNHYKRFIVFSTYIAVTLLLPFGSSGCGLDWKLPANHFDGVDSNGQVAYWENIGEVDLGGGFKLPMIIGFKAAKENGTGSPYLGKGWIFPLLESNMVQNSDNTFLMTQPDGWINFFRRNNTEETVLQGSAEWKAIINGDTITAWAPCGWKIVFYKGRITSMTTPKNRKLEYVYSANAVTEIREGGIAKLTIDRAATGNAQALVFNGKRLELEMGQKPLVQQIAGQRVVGALTESLKSLILDSRTTETFEFAVDEQMLPTLKIWNKVGTKRKFTWDPITKQIISDNDWNYRIRKSDSNNASIERINSQKQNEYWFDDLVNGEVTVQGNDGIRFITRRFLNAGILSGKVRSVTQIKNNVPTTLRRCSYNEHGQLIRESVKLNSSHIFTFKYDEKGKQTDIDVDNKPFCRKKYDEQGRLIAKTLSSGVRKVFEYSTDGIKETITTKNGDKIREISTAAIK